MRVVVVMQNAYVRMGTMMTHRMNYAEHVTILGF